MADSLPPWLLQNLDPISGYIRSYAIGAQIGEAQTRIAEQQRQANMEHAAKSQALQANILKAQQEMLLEKAYKDQQLSLENARLTEMGQRNAEQAQHAAAVLEETKRRNMEAALQAAASLRERQTFHEGQLAKQPVHFGQRGEVLRYNPDTGEVETLKPPEPEASKSTKQLQVSEAEKQFTELQKLRSQMTAAETEPGKKLSREQMRALKDAIWNKDLDYREAMYRATNAPGATATSPGAVPIPAPTTAPTTTAPEGLPLPKTKAELKAGQVYQTSRGPARWDGEKFISL